MENAEGLDWGNGGVWHQKPWQTSGGHSVLCPEINCNSLLKEKWAHLNQKANWTQELTREYSWRERMLGCGLAPSARCSVRKCFLRFCVLSYTVLLLSLIRCLNLIWKEDRQGIIISWTRQYAIKHLYIQVLNCVPQAIGKPGNIAYCPVTRECLWCRVSTY